MASAFMLLFDSVGHQGGDAMNRERLSAWVKDLYASGLKWSEIGSQLGVSGSAVTQWRDKDTKRLSPKNIAAIAAFKNEGVEVVCEWLEIPMPKGADLSSRVDRLQGQVDELTTAFNSLAENFSRGFLHATPFAVALQDELIAGHVDLRTIQGQQMFMELATKSLNSEFNARQAMLKIQGYSLINSFDYPLLSNALRSVLGPKWTTNYLGSLAATMPTHTPDPSHK